MDNKLKFLRTQKKLRQVDVANYLNISQQAYANYERGAREPNQETLVKLAEYYGVTTDYLLGRDDLPTNAVIPDLVSLPVIGTIRAGYDGACIEEFTGEDIFIDRADLHGEPLSEFFVLQVKGDSMYPMFLDGDKVLIRRTDSVDPETIAAVLYNGDEATLKKVSYKKGEDWLDLIPVNPMYQPLHIEGCDLANCRVLGEVTQLIRKFTK